MAVEGRSDSGPYVHDSAREYVRNGRTLLAVIEGGVHTSTGAPPSARFPGQWFQSESGLHQNWMRDYDPTTGRYLQADPLGLVDGASVYGYAGQSPMMNMDPSGQCFGPLIALAPACAGAVWGMAIYLAYEYIFDDGCWTWKGLFAAAATGAAYGALGGPTGLGFGWRGAGGGAAGGVAGNLADDLSAAANAGLKNGLTGAGRAYQKHSSRPGSSYPPVSGHSNLNTAGQSAVESIIRNPGTVAKPNRFGGTDYIALNVQGLRFDANGNFMGLLEP